MVETARFAAKLVDETSSPAERAAASVTKLTRAYERLQDKSVRSALGTQLAMRIFQRIQRDRVNAGLNPFDLQKIQAGMSALQASGRAFSAVTPYAAAAATAIAGIGVAAGIASVAVTGLAAVAAVKFGAAAFEASVWAEQFRKSLGVVAQSEEQGAQEFERIRRLAQDHGLVVQDTIQEYQRLRNLKFAPEDAERIVKLTADLQALGVRAEAVGSIMNAIGKIKAQGKLQGDELMMLAEAGVPVSLVYENLAESLGKSRDEIMKMQAAGQLLDGPSLAAIEKAIMQTANETEAGQAAKMLADSTMRGFIAQSKAGLFNWLVDVGDKLAPGFNTIAKKLKGTLETLTESGQLQRFTDSLLRAFGAVSDWVIANWPRIEAVIGAVVDEATLALNQLADAVDWLGQNFNISEDTLVSAVRVIFMVTKAAFALGVALLAIPAATLLVWASVNELADKLMASSDQFFRAGEALGIALVKGLLLPIRVLSPIANLALSRLLGGGEGEPGGAAEGTQAPAQSGTLQRLSDFNSNEPKGMSAAVAGVTIPISVQASSSGGPRADEELGTMIAQKVRTEVKRAMNALGQQGA